MCVAFIQEQVLACWTDGVRGNTYCMKRRTFILGGGALSVISVSITATAADFTNSVEVGSDFRAVPDVVNVSLDVESSEPDEQTDHTWELRNARIEETVVEVTVEYPAGTSFDGLTDNDITIEFERPNGNFRDLTLEDGEYSGSNATFVIDDSQSELIDEAIVEIEGIENPEPGSYSPDITFVTDEESDNTYTANSAELVISSDDAFFVVEIDDAPEIVEEGDTLTVEYTVENLDGGIATKDVVFLIDGSQEDTREHALEVGESESDTFDYSVDGDEGTFIDVVVETEDTDDDRQVLVAGWGLDVDPQDDNTEATHTWENGLVEFDGEIDEIIIEYEGDSQVVDLDDVDDDSITVELGRDGDEEPEEVAVVDSTTTEQSQGQNSDSTLIIELDGSQDTSTDGEAIVEIDDIENPNQDFEGTITLSGDDDETTSNPIQITL